MFFLGVEIVLLGSLRDGYEILFVVQRGYASLLVKKEGEEIMFFRIIIVVVVVVE